MTGGRIPFAEAGGLARSAIRRANGLLVDKQLTPSDLRALGAVVSLTALYSRRGDRVYLAQLAAISYGVTEAQPWMLEKVRKSLVQLEAAGLIDRRAPTGRPRDDEQGPAYWVALSHLETQPGAGLDSHDETQPGAGLDSKEKRQPRERQKGSPGRSGKAARRAPRRQPSPGGPTEESPGKVLPEEDSEHATNVRPARSSTSSPTTADDEDDDRTEIVATIADAIHTAVGRNYPGRPNPAELDECETVARAITDQPGYLAAEVDATIRPLFTDPTLTLARPADLHDRYRALLLEHEVDPAEIPSRLERDPARNRPRSATA